MFDYANVIYIIIYFLLQELKVLTSAVHQESPDEEVRCSFSFIRLNGDNYYGSTSIYVLSRNAAIDFNFIE